MRILEPCGRLTKMLSTYLIQQKDFCWDVCVYAFHKVISEYWAGRRSHHLFMELVLTYEVCIRHTMINEPYSVVTTLVFYF